MTGEDATPPLPVPLDVVARRLPIGEAARIAFSTGPGAWLSELET